MRWRSRSFAVALSLITWHCTWAMLPSLIVFDLDACLWSPEMYELSSPPSSYCSKRRGVAAGAQTVRLFPGAEAVLRRFFPSCVYDTLSLRACIRKEMP
ncbi:unnamed protein product [Durusdinium trenchii]|uniref:Magnesium-dependent phosphatase 1 n=1 Tax=Durusdinium trenchii TaxID=1381693 RepID=A0ABP0QBU2_9DINO